LCFPWLRFRVYAEICCWSSRIRSALNFRRREARHFEVIRGRGDKKSDRFVIGMLSKKKNMGHVDIFVCPRELSVYLREKFLESSRYIRYVVASDGFRERRVRASLRHAPSGKPVSIKQIHCSLLNGSRSAEKSTFLWRIPFLTVFSTVIQQISPQAFGECQIQDSALLLTSITLMPFIAISHREHEIVPRDVFHPTCLKIRSISVSEFWLNFLSTEISIFLGRYLATSPSYWIETHLMHMEKSNIQSGNVCFDDRMSFRQYFDLSEICHFSLHTRPGVEFLVDNS
jgi:hypothetical protein